MITENPLLDPSFPLPPHDPFTRAMAREAGVSDSQLSRLRNDGWLRHPVRRLYIGSHVPDTLATRTSALSLVVPPGSFISDFTAAWLHAGDIALPPNAHLETPRVSVFRPAMQNRLRNDLTSSGQRSLLPRDLTTVGGILVTTPLRTALDLGRLQHSDDLAMHGMDRMLALNCFTLEELLSEVPRFRGERWVTRLRVRAPRADGRAASFGESALRNRWCGAGLPKPELQVPVFHDGRVLFWLDMALPELYFAAEYDGEEWHSDPAALQYDTARREWMTENRAWQIEVFRREHVFGREQDAYERLAAGYRRARASLGHRVILL